MQSSFMSDRHGSPSKGGILSTPGKVRGTDGKAQEMSLDEMKARYLELEEGNRVAHLQDKHAKNINIQGAWSNREDEWYFTNKRLLFTTKAGEITDEWVEKLNALVTDP